MNVLEKVKQIKSEAKKRKFIQTVDLIINLKDLDLKKPENRFNFEFFLPEGKGKENKIAIISDTLGEEAKYADFIIKKNEIDALAKNKKKLKSIANKYDIFYAEASIMSLVIKAFGAILGPRKKIPKPIPPKIKIEPIIKRARNLINISVRESPNIQLVVGREDMPDEKIAKNIEATYNFVKEHLPKGKINIKSVQIKLTMGKPVKLDI